MAHSPVQPVSKAAAAYASLRRSIRTGELSPGQRVTLKELSELLEMSLTPVREALNRLVSEGYAVHDAHRGTFIADQSRERVEQIYRLRAVLEPMAVKLAAEMVAMRGAAGADVPGAEDLELLLQRSEGGALGIGGGGGGGFLTARGTANLLTRTTAILAVLFILTSMTLARLAGGERVPRSILDAPQLPAQEQPVQPAQPEEPAAPIAR